MSFTNGPWVICVSDRRLVSVPGAVEPINAGSADRAVLIAAAPDFLVACQAYMAERKELGLTADSKAVKAIRKAIAKAVL